jgi:hypothetical protein
MWLKLLLISLLLTSSVLAQRATLPIARDTSQASKNLQKQTKMILRQLETRAQYIDSNFVRWGIDTVAINDSTTITIGATYATAYSYAAVVQPKIATDLSMYCTTHTKTTFVVHNPSASQVIFRWITVGIKER